MNVRKMTSGQVAEAAGIEHQRLTALLDPGHCRIWPDEIAVAVVDALGVDAGKLCAEERDDMSVITKSGAEMRRSRRGIQRDGIHFYNYYDMAAPPNVVAPVILDILCPDDRIPALNNRHLEPAITVNLGPGDIHGRWGNDLSSSTWQVLKANDGTDKWIVGDSYVEPSYCPHSYSLVTRTPARIVSYTGYSNLAPLEEINNWPESAAGALFGQLDQDLPPQGLASLLLSRRGYELPSAAAALEMETGQLAAALDHGQAEVLGRLGRRSKDYAAAGADCIFLEAMLNVDEMKRVRDELDVPLLANMVEGGKTPWLTTKELEEIGYNLVIYPLSGWYAATAILRKLFAALRDEGTTQPFWERQDLRMTFSELFEVFDYSRISELESRFVVRDDSDVS